MTVSNKTISRNVYISDYIPLQVQSDEEFLATDYWYFKQGDHSLLELAFNQEDNSIRRITLLLCKEFEKIDNKYLAPINPEPGDILVNASGECETEMFRTIIYNDAVKIQLSNNNSHTCIASGNKVWELAENGDLISLCIIDSTGALSKHCFAELDAIHSCSC